MFRGIDHLVVVVPELEAAISRYGDAGFTVVRGGRHPIGTHNALIAFADGAYIELIAFLNAAPGHPWYAALETHGGGLVDFCIQTDDLEADVDSLRRAGARMTDPYAMTRERPDGYKLNWVLSIPQPPFNGRLPFLIRDETPRDERIPRQRRHRNGVAGIQGVTVAVKDPSGTDLLYAAVLGRGGAPWSRPDIGGAGVAFAIGAHRIELVAAQSEASPIAEWMGAHGESPFEARLIAPGLAPEKAGTALLSNARLLIVPH
jgi:catechol 2,3-dioxygenase-like lactoylglutathione lyase family enzyme